MFQLPQEIKNDIEQYRHSLEEFNQNKISSSRFKGIRVPWGLYSHRGGSIFMARVRIPAGVINSAQLKALANTSKKFGSGILHITTRQDVQIHDVKLEDTINVMEYLKDYELSPRGGGGNTIRNVIACPHSGISKDEIFSVREYAVSLSEYILQQEISFSLPRKFKIAFSGCENDCAGCLVNDLGFLARQENGGVGFKVFVGGGMGAKSGIGRLIEDFLPAEDLGYCATAVRNVYYRFGDRRNKHHNRLRFLIEDMGFEKFKNFYRKEFEKLKEEEYIMLRKINFSGNHNVDSKIPDVEDAEYNDFLLYNVIPQKQSGFSSVELRIPRGDVSSEELSRLGELEKDFPGIEFRTTQNQNVLISWVKNCDVYKLFLNLKSFLYDFLYPQTLLDIVACKGALTCNLGLCNSPGLAEEIEKMIKEEFIGSKIFKKLDIRINGCPNACAQHPIGKISFYGLVRKVGNRPVPFYRFLIGGRKQAELTKFADEVGLIPAKNIPNFLKSFLKKVDEMVEENDDIYKFLDGPAKEVATHVLKDYLYVPSHSENKDFYIDYGKNEEFSLAGLGPGECGAGVIDMIEADLGDAKLSLEKAEKNNFLAEDIKSVLYFSARALLIVKGKDSQSVDGVFNDFLEKFINEGISSKVYSDIKNVFEDINENLNVKQKIDKFNYARKFYEHITGIYKSMDSSFNFLKHEKSIEKEVSVIKTLDLKGTPCPINYVKAKIFLENLDSGDLVEIFLDGGEPINNVPKSLEADGHKILKTERQDEFYKVVVERM